MLAPDPPQPPAGTPAPAADTRMELPEPREDAEKRRQRVAEVLPSHAPPDAQRLVRELLLAQAEAQAARAQYVDLYDFAPVA